MKYNSASDALYDGIGHMDEKWIALCDAPAAAGKRQKRHFVGYEIKKLLGVKYLWIFLLIFLLINSGIAWYTAGKTPAAAEPTDLIAEFFAQYMEDPRELDAHYAELQAFAAQQNALLQAAYREGNYHFEIEQMPSLYSDLPNYPDDRLFAKLYDTLAAVQGYPDVLDEVIVRAQANLKAFADMGVAEESFTYRYQLRVIDLYRQMRDSVRIELEYTRGWDEYFAYDTVNIFIFLMVVMLGSLMFAGEKQSGFLPILRSTRHGRARTGTAKVLTMLLLSACFVLMFTLSTFAVYGLRLGFSSPSNAVQALGTFTLSPYRITVGQYFLITLGVKLLTFSVFSGMILVLSVLFYQYVLIYFAGLGVFGLNFLLYTLTYIDANSVGKNLNLVATASVNPLFVRYRAVNLFGEVAGYVPTMLVSFSALILLCAGAAVLLYAKGSGGIRLGVLDSLLARCMTARAALRNRFRRRRSAGAGRVRVYSRSLILAEVFKTLISSRFIVILLLILTVKVWYSWETNAPSNSFADGVYAEYMTVLEGELTEEKLDYLARERAMINEVLAREKAMEQAYFNEEITAEEYRDYLAEYSYAYSRDDLLSVIEKHASYLQKKEAETGVRGWFVYDTGWRKMYAEGADLFLYAALLLLLAGSFAAEYTAKSSGGSFAQLLRSTKHGRHRTFYAKLIASGVIALILSLLCGGVDAAVIALGHDLPAAQAPLLSLQMFDEVTGSITVGQYFALFFVMRMAGALLMAMLVCALSELLARYIPVLGTAVVLTLLPALCAYFGLAAADQVNFLNLLAGTPLFLRSAETALFGNGYAMLLLWVTVAVAAVTAVMMPAKRMFVK